MARSRKEVQTAAILRSAWAAQVAAQESLPAEQCAPVPAACAPICSSDSTHTSEALQGPVTIRRGGAVAATNKVPKRSRSKSLECPPERPLKRRALPGNAAADCSSSEHSTTPVPAKPESSRPAGYDMVACTLHPEFYQRTGDCVIMVEHMLFRLSWDLLVDSSPVFAESLGPSQSGVIPFLHLEGDSVEDFTALCWALTSEPDKAEERHGTNVEESLRLGRLFTMATKYKIPRYRDWSRTMFLSCSQDILASWSLDSTMNILASAGGSPDKDAALEALMYDVLKTRMDEQSKYTLEFAKALGLRQLQGYIYYQELLKMNSSSASPPESAASDRGWTPAQMGVLFRGFWSISRYWDTLKTPPQLPGSAAGQDHDEVCVKKWKRMWRRGRALGLRGAKPAYSPLLALEGLVGSVEEGIAEHCGCHFAAAAKEVRRTLLSALGDHFLGPSEMPKAVISEDSGQGVSSRSPSKVPKVVESGDGQDVSDDSVDKSDGESADESSDNSDDESGDSSSDDSSEDSGEEDSSGDDQD